MSTKKTAINPKKILKFTCELSISERVYEALNLYSSEDFVGIVEEELREKCEDFLENYKKKIIPKPILEYLNAVENKYSLEIKQE